MQSEPPTADRAPAPPPRALDGPAPRRVRVLLVDEDERRAEGLLVRLRSRGLLPGLTRVDDEGAFREALHPADGVHPDVIVSELASPGICARRALEVRRELGRDDVPVIVVSADLSDREGAALVELGATDYLQQDRLERLPGALLQAIATRRASSASQAGRRQFELLVRHAADVMMLLDERGRLLYANPALERLLGLPLDELSGRTPMEFSHPDDLARVEAHLARSVVQPGEQAPFTVRIRQADGGYRQVESLISNMLQDPLVRALVVNARDVTDRERRRAQDLAQREVLEHIARGAPLVDVLADLVDAADAGGAAAVHVEVHHPDLPSSSHGTGDVPDGAHEAQVTTADGVEAATVRVAGEDVEEVHRRTADLLGIALERELDRQRLALAARTDLLTGLPNRTDLELRLAALGRQPAALVIIDIERLGGINEALGHDAGDAVLQIAAQRIRAAVDERDHVARLPSDEFAVLHRGTGDVTPTASAAAVAERVLRDLARPMAVGPTDLRVGAGAGVVTVDGAGDLSTLLADADTALRQARTAGTRSPTVMDAAMRAAKHERLRLAEALRRAVGGAELRLHLQPVVRLDDRAVVHHEALLRWDHPERGLLGPGAFLDVARDADLIAAIGRWVLDRAAELLAHRPDRRLSVNADPRELLDGRYARRVLRTLERHDVDPSRLAIEITENAVMSNPDVVVATLTTLRSAGVQIHLDDFGTGYSSLSHLQGLPADVVKIDRSFVDGVADQPRTAGLVEGIAAMARALSLPTVAEGVESAAQAARLRELGIPLGQGYHLGRPTAEPAGDGLAPPGHGR